MDARDFFGYKHPDEVPGRRDEPEDEAERPPLPEEAITLDDQATIARIDTGDMLGHVRELPRQLARARAIAAATPLPAAMADVDAVLVLGMGGSAIGAELVAGAAGARLRVPLIVHRDYDLPGWVGPRTLVIASSHSGETVETLRASEAARARGLPVAVISTGGSLSRASSDAGEPVLRYEAPGQPRAAVGYSVGILHGLLAGAGLIADPDPLGHAVEAVEAVLERNAPAVDTAANPAKQLAWSVFGRAPVVYGAGAMAPVAHRWKTQLNENAKAWAAWEPMPEANHNAIEGSLNPRELGDAFYVVEVRDPQEPTEIAARYRTVDELLGPRAASRSTVWVEGGSPLARVLTGVAIGDLVSVYLAILYQTDPTPVTLLAMLKERLARTTG